MAKTTDDECVGYARECVRLSGLTADPQLQDHLLKMAREWMAEAMHDPRPLEKLQPATPARSSMQAGGFAQQGPVTPPVTGP